MKEIITYKIILIYLYNFLYIRYTLISLKKLLFLKFSHPQWNSVENGRSIKSTFLTKNITSYMFII